MAYKKEIIILIIISLAVLVFMPYKSETTSFAPNCFEKEDCFKNVKTGYCGLNYDCISGKCYYQDVACKPKCSTMKQYNCNQKSCECKYEPKWVKIGDGGVCAC